MPLAIEHDVEYQKIESFQHGVAYGARHIGGTAKAIEWLKDHPTKDIAVAVAIERALVAKKESE